MKYLICKVATIKKETGKVIKCGYLSDSISYTEAEVKIYEKMEKIVGLNEFFDLENITKMKFDEIFSSKGFTQIIIDLSELDFMDSTGIGVLIGRYKKMKDKNIPIYICNPSNHAEKIFKMTGLYEIMPKII